MLKIDINAKGTATTQNTCGPSAATYAACEASFTFKTGFDAPTTQIVNLLPNAAATDTTVQPVCTSSCTNDVTYKVANAGYLQTSHATAPASEGLCTKTWIFEYPRVACVQWTVNIKRILNSLDTVNDIALYPLTTATVDSKTYNFNVFAGASDDV